jgi:hypothetical protein
MGAPLRINRGAVGTAGLDGDFACYNPIDFTTRHLSCERPSGPAKFGPHHILPDPANISLEAAKLNLLAADVVGITELYAASWCVALHRLLRTLPDSCRLTCLSGAASAQHKHVTHNKSGNMPAHSTADVPAEVLSEVDAITSSDAELYLIGVKRLRYGIAKKPLLTLVELVEQAL